MHDSNSTRLLAVSADHPEAALIAEAAACLLAGGLVAFPTETVYGLGANALDADAVRRIYTAKERPALNPLIAHIATLEQLEQVAHTIPAVAYRLAAHFWPGPLTLVLPRQPHVPGIISAGRETVAVRLPAHPVAQALIAAAGVPVVAPSANRSTRPSATTAQHVLADLAGRIDLVLDSGPTRIGVESTVVDLTGAVPVLLRPGGVPLETLRDMLPDIITHDATVEPDAPAAPGMLTRHYSPAAEVLLFSGEREAALRAMREAAAAYARAGVLAVDEDLPAFADFAGVKVALGPEADLAQVAHRLFAALRALDEQGVDYILVRQFAPEGLGRTLADRLRRAADGRVIVVG